MASKKSTTRNKVKVNVKWCKGDRTRAWEELWRRILAEIDVGGKILIPNDAQDHFLQEQHEAD